MKNSGNGKGELVSIVLICVLSLISLLWVSFSIGGEALFNKIRESDISGLLTFVGIAVAVVLIRENGKKLKSATFGFGFIMALAHFLATSMPSLDVSGPGLAFTAGDPHFYVVICFVVGICGMSVSSLYLFRIQALESETSKVDPAPTVAHSAWQSTPHS